MFEGSIYSFHSVGPDVSLELEIDPDMVNYTITPISTPVKVTHVPTAYNRLIVVRSYKSYTMFYIGDL